jgi:hypothetical protein
LRLFAPRARYLCSWSGKVLVLAPGEIPTLDFYLRSRLSNRPDSNRPNCSWEYRGSLADFADTPALDDGTFVVLVRHAGKAWLRALAQQAERLSGVAYLMDDDIPAAWRCADVPLDYGFWTSGRYWMARSGLARVCDRVWVSTPELARRYGTGPASVLPPLPFDPPAQVAPVGCRRWAYHGTRVHHRELKWLVPVVKAVQTRCPEAGFEVFGNAAVAALFAGIPRVTLLPPRPWPEYLAHARAHPLAVGLAPLLPGRFNAARSHVKMFDIARSGGVGIFSEGEPYASALTGSGAILLPNDSLRWADEIVALLKDDARRQACFALNANWMQGLDRDTGPGLP